MFDRTTPLGSNLRVIGTQGLSGASRLYSHGTYPLLPRNPPKRTLLRQGYGGLPTRIHRPTP